MRPRTSILAASLLLLSASVPAAAAVPSPRFAEDQTDPTVGSLALHLRSGTVAASGVGRLPVRATFSASDDTGVTSTALLIDGSLMVFPPAATPAATTIDALAPDAQSVDHRYTAIAKDAADNTGSSDTYQFRTWAVKDNDITFGGSWSTQNGGSLYRGSSRYASVKGRTAQVTVAKVTDLAWVSTRGPDRGKATVSIDGSVVATIDLYASSLKPRRVVFTTALTKGSHTIRIRVLGSHSAHSSGNRVDVDAILALRPNGLFGP